MQVLPLTPGLLASAMMRRDHAVFMPGNDTFTIGLEAPEERIPKAMREALESYEQAEAGGLSDPQVLEEFTGSGFYAPQREEGYTTILDRFPGMLSLARQLISERH